MENLKRKQELLQAEIQQAATEANLDPVSIEYYLSNPDAELDDDKEGEAELNLANKFRDSYNSLKKAFEEQADMDRKREAEENERKEAEAAKRKEKALKKKPGLFSGFFGKSEAKISSTIQVDEEFLALFGNYVTIVGGTQSWESAISWLKTVEGDRRKKITACVIFHLKPTQLLITGRTKSMERSQMSAKMTVDPKVARFLPKITSETIDEMTAEQKAEFNRARRDWGSAFKNLNRSMITKIGMLAEEFEPSWFPDLVEHNKRMGGVPSKRVLTQGVGASPKTIEVFNEHKSRMLKARSVWENREFMDAFR